MGDELDGDVEKVRRANRGADRANAGLESRERLEGLAALKHRASEAIVTALL